MIQPSTTRLPIQTLADQIRQNVGHELAQVEKLLSGATASRYPEVERLCRGAAALGGKRLRPTLVWLSARSVATTALEHRCSSDLSSIAAAVELVHAASLVHDDVMDGASERRHLPTIVAHAGNSTAVLLGDLLFTRAYALAANCRSTYPARRLAAASTQLCVGELRQQTAAGAWSISQREYLGLLKQKTGALCRVSSQLGSWRAGGTQQQILAVARFGSLLGLAFQIRDDWLDFWGTQQVGKTLGTDLAQSKPTLPMIRLLSTVSASERRELLRRLEAGGADNLAFAREQLDRSDAGPYTLAAARRCAARAAEQLVCLPESPAKQCLSAMADYSVQRDM